MQADGIIAQDRKIQELEKEIDRKDEHISQLTTTINKQNETLHAQWENLNETTKLKERVRELEKQLETFRRNEMNKIVNKMRRERPFDDE